MINFENSLKNKTDSLKKLIQLNYKYALDLGCGSGTDSIALSELGLSVVAVDQSQIQLQILIAQHLKEITPPSKRCG